MPQHKKTHSEGSRRSPRQKVPSTAENTVAAFTACPRCSFFLAGYRLIQDDFQEAVKNNDGDWIDLTWNPNMRNLIHKSYGCRIDVDAYYYEWSCRECRRAFVYQVAGQEGRPNVFRVQINPR